MKLMLVGSWERATFAEIGSRFGRGEDVEPEGATILSRWHDPSSRMFWVVVETDDAAAVQRWTLAWSDDVDWETYVVMDDAETGAILQDELGL